MPIITIAIKRPNTLWFYGSFFALLGCTSALYHAAFAFSTDNLVLSRSAWFASDQTLSTAAFGIVLFHAGCTRCIWRDTLANWVLVAVPVLVYVQFGSAAVPYQTWYVVSVAVMSVLWYIATGAWAEQMSIALVCAVVSAIIGITMFLVVQDDSVPYAVRHSIWHACVFSAAYFIAINAPHRTDPCISRTMRTGTHQIIQ